jgi:molybdopterin converting factor small subunit
LRSSHVDFSFTLDQKLDHGQKVYLARRATMVLTLEHEQKLAKYDKEPASIASRKQQNLIDEANKAAEDLNNEHQAAIDKLYNEYKEEISELSEELNDNFGPGTSVKFASSTSSAADAAASSSSPAHGSVSTHTRTYCQRPRIRIVVHR